MKSYPSDLSPPFKRDVFGVFSLSNVIAYSLEECSFGACSCLQHPSSAVCKHSGKIQDLLWAGRPSSKQAHIKNKAPPLSQELHQNCVMPEPSKVRTNRRIASVEGEHSTLKDEEMERRDMHSCKRYTG